jgi:hypothetical protein
LETISLPYDRRMIPGAGLDALDLELVKRTIESAFDLDRSPGTRDALTYLERYNGITHDGDTIRPTVAGMIVFGYEQPPGRRPVSERTGHPSHCASRTEHERGRSP